MRKTLLIHLRYLRNRVFLMLLLLPHFLHTQEKLSVIAVWHDAGGEPVQPAGWRVLVQVHHVGTKHVPSNTPQDFNALVGAVQVWPLGYNYPYGSGNKVTDLQQAMSLLGGREAYNNPDLASLSNAGFQQAKTVSNATFSGGMPFSLNLPRYSREKEGAGAGVVGFFIELHKEFGWQAYDSDGKSLPNTSG